MKHNAGYGISENTPVPALTYDTFASTGRQKMNVCGDWYRKELLTKLSSVVLRGVFTGWGPGSNRGPPDWCPGH
ncbi:hypothetical protein LGE20_004863 [Salmonella enterica]|nr:hypothetical protein [Salmonella enterica]HBJ6313561.1 hypothetical protein [Salmonella enterica subsp. diarizonae serovar 50:r:z]EIG9537186.1 hypothetical protein [Salmonella enterica]EIH0807491.1 hypothetical protein [Salmonella enterica]EIH2226207.1 hypothetical protein [Salmonella enterica]